MRSFLLLPLLGLSALSSYVNARAIEDTQSLSQLFPRKFQPLSNPYTVPGSPITLDFDDHPDRVLPRQAVISLLNRSRRAIATQIHLKGDTQIPPGLQGYRSATLQLSYESAPQYRMMRYSEVLMVIRGLINKMEAEGYRERSAIVTYDAVDGHMEVETGEVDIGRIG